MSENKSFLLAVATGVLLGLPLAWLANEDKKLERQRYYEVGCEHGRSGVSAEANPFYWTGHRKAWLEGWIEGNKQRAK